jgi:hypothetical protein
MGHLTEGLQDNNLPPSPTYPNMELSCHHVLSADELEAQTSYCPVHRTEY